MIQKPFVGEFKISQKFGENLNPYYKAEGLLGHQGIDFAMPTGTPVLSAVNGTVIAVSVDIQKGEGVAVMSSDIFKYKGQDCLLDTIYWHMKDQTIKVKVGDRVEVGDVLGLSNNTGQSTGPHLHFSVIPMATDGSRRPLEPNNGYRSCVDPALYLDIEGPQIKHIRALQTFLNVNGASLVVDGKWGAKSEKALRDFIS